MFFRSFKKELTVYALGLVFVTISLTTAISIFSTKTAGDDAAKATSEVLRAQAEELLIQVTTSAAQQQDIVFEQILIPYFVLSLQNQFFLYQKNMLKESMLKIML